jgi:glutamate formiminotransferase / 5-formyltetrahydrofolate cyclo-ligase
VLECVINISEGRHLGIIEVIARTAGAHLLDVHTDGDHNRSVLTVVGEDTARAVATAAVLALDLRHHDGVHPRLGVVDVVPFVPLGSATLAETVAARDRFGTWMAQDLGVPCFFYGMERSLPEVRRDAFGTLLPDRGPDRPHPTAGATAVGARAVLVAFNLWLEDADLARARTIAATLRSPAVRALGLPVGDHVQVSMNLVDPLVVGPADVYDRVAADAPVARAELVGLLPEAVLHSIDSSRWDALDLAEDRTIENRLAAAGLSAE